MHPDLDLRPELPHPIPAPIGVLPRDRGYPVPWFVAWFDLHDSRERALALLDSPIGPWPRETVAS